MRQAQHASNTSTLLPPEGVNREECTALPITRLLVTALDRHDLPVVRSYWLPSKEELTALNRGAKVCFHVWGTSHPPVLLGVEKVHVSPRFLLDDPQGLALVGEEG